MPHSLICGKPILHDAEPGGPALFDHIAALPQIRQAFRIAPLVVSHSLAGLRQSRHRSGHERKTFAKDGGIFLVDTLTGCGPVSCSGSPCKPVIGYRVSCLAGSAAVNLAAMRCRSSARIASSKSSAKVTRRLIKVFRNVRHFSFPFLKDYDKSQDDRDDHKATVKEICPL